MGRRPVLPIRAARRPVLKASGRAAQSKSEIGAVAVSWFDRAVRDRPPSAGAGRSRGAPATPARTIHHGGAKGLFPVLGWWVGSNSAFSGQNSPKNARPLGDRRHYVDHYTYQLMAQIPGRTSLLHSPCLSGCFDMNVGMRLPCDLARHHDRDAEASGSGCGRTGLDVTDFPFLQFSKKDVVRAGKTIAGNLLWNEQAEAEIRHAFLVANNWRDAHSYPMASVRSQLIEYVRHLNLEGVTARLKRMQAIRRKLYRPDFKRNLSQLQDIAGCRVILMSIADVKTFTSALVERSRHTLEYPNDYITSPKRDGYRSHHLIFRYNGERERPTYFLASELKFKSGPDYSMRGQLQEEINPAVSRRRPKGTQGSEDWLRLFQLMSGEFALAEKCPKSPLLPPRRERLKEIIDLARKLDATAVLENLSNAVRGTKIIRGDRPQYYIISYDNASMRVDVEPYSKPIEAIQSYDLAEYSDNQPEKTRKTLC